MAPSGVQPVGSQVSRTAKVVGRAFGEALAAAGGSEPVWLILLSLKTDPGGTQRHLADRVGIREATLTHHLNTMEREGLITRTRSERNRRIHQVELTAAGDAAFHRLRAAAIDFDRRLRAGLDDVQLEAFRNTLRQLADNVGPQDAEGNQP